VIGSYQLSGGGIIGRMQMLGDSLFSLKNACNRADISS
jgi:hypothetical protein